jgi:hypothetical protein
MSFSTYYVVHALNRAFLQSRGSLERRYALSSSLRLRTSGCTIVCTSLQASEAIYGAMALLRFIIRPIAA